MIFRKTLLHIPDTTNAIFIRVFNLYKGFLRKQTRIGYFVKSSIRKVRVPRIFYKGFKISFYKKGDICKSIITKTCYFYHDKYLLSKKLQTNGSIIIFKKNLIKAKKFYGITFHNLNYKKVINLFKFYY